MALYIYARFNRKIHCFLNLQYIMCCEKLIFAEAGIFIKQKLIREENIGINYVECRDMIAPFKWLYNFLVPSVSKDFFFNYHKIT